MKNAVTTAHGELWEEVDRWKTLGHPIRIWWRDDDATTHTENLDALFRLAQRFGLSVALAVIPKHVDRILVESIHDWGVSCAWQHGWSHADHGGRSEFGDNRPIADMVNDAELGRARMDKLFGEDGWQPVFVPPWNQVSESFKELLPSLGYRGISTAGAIVSRNPKEINVEIDIIDWKDSPRIKFVGAESCVHQLLKAMVWRRSLDCFDQPIGLITHHVDHDPDIWGGLESFMETTLLKVSSQFVDPRTHFPPRRA
jgi:hypothetical protein